MAELNQEAKASGNSKPIKVRSRKLGSRVD